MNGETITLIDSSNARFRNFVIEGNSIQDGEPTPEIPVEIESVDDVNVNVHCKNLLNPIGTNQTIKGVVFTNNGDGSFTIKGTSTGAMSFPLTDLAISPMYLLKGKTYTQSIIMIDGVKDDSFAIVPAVKDSEGNITWNYLDDNQTKTTDKNYSFYAYTVYINGGVTVNATFKVQLEEGSVATDWKPYKGLTSTIPLSEPLRSLPNGIKDTIEKDGIHRRVGTTVLDGDEVWNYSNFEATFFIYVEELGMSYKSEYGLSNRFKNIPDTTITANTSACDKLNDGEFAFRSGTTKDRIYFKHVGSGNDLTNFKNYVSENPVTIQYELANEIIEPFTEEQQTAYDNIINNGTYKTTTNIYSSNEVAPTFKVEYSKDLETIINNLG